MGPLVLLAFFIQQKVITVRFSTFRHVSTFSILQRPFEQPDRQVSLLPRGPIRRACRPFGHALEAGWSGIGSIEHQT